MEIRVQGAAEEDLLDEEASWQAPKERLHPGQEARQEGDVCRGTRLAAADMGVERKEPVDLAAVVQDAVEAVGSQIEALGLRLEQHSEPATVSGDWSLLERLAGNLIENAVRYNVPGGWVEVETRAEGGQAVLRVANTGPVFAQTDVGLLFEPFRRGVQERTESAKGAGLGLSIVRAVASAHGGKVEAATLAGSSSPSAYRCPLVGLVRRGRCAPTGPPHYANEFIVASSPASPARRANCVRYSFA